MGTDQISLGSRIVDAGPLEIKVVGRILVAVVGDRRMAFWHPIMFLWCALTGILGY